jgi:NADH-quinone oxidoreductase subunit L
MLINRVGDFALLLALFCIYFIFNSLDYDIVFSLISLSLDYRILISDLQIPVVDFICFFLFLGAMGKSAQVGLHT